MKKGIALLLVLIMVLSLAACGTGERYPEIADLLDAKDYEGAVQKIYQLYLENEGGNGGDGTMGGDGETEAKPTDEERNQLYEYRNIIMELNDYLEGNNPYFSWDGESYNGNDAMTAMYKRLQELTAVDKWVGTKYVTDDYISDASEVNWNRQEVLDAFRIVKDVKLKVLHSSKDNMGNENDPSSIAWWDYNLDGSVAESYEYGIHGVLYHWTNHNSAKYEYDNSGKLINKKYGYDDHVSALVTYTYDNAGNIAKETVKTNDYEMEFTYACDAAGRVTQIDWVDGSNIYTITYTYDAAGRVLKAEKARSYQYSSHVSLDVKYIMEYTYDPAGVPVSAVYNEQDWTYESEYLGGGEYVYTNVLRGEKKDTVTFTCDSQGRVLTQTVIPGTGVYVSGSNAGETYDKPSYESAVYETVYGDYYIYAPNN